MNKKRKIALITGITGQDGSYLTELLLEKNYEVHGLKRRSSSLNTQRIDHLYENPQKTNPSLILHYGDLTDSTNIIKIIQKVKPDEIYNLGAQSHVSVSFESPEYTANSDALGTLRILEAVRILGMQKKTKIYQASTSELYGLVQETPQSEKTPFYPRSPYGVAKVYAHWITINYREAYGIFASNGILFNHESFRRGGTFVTKKIVSALCKIKLGKQKKLYLGNLYAKRDWGDAREFVHAMWKILQQKKPSDYVIATGKQYSVKQFVNIVLKKLKFRFYWKGKNLNEKCYLKNSNTPIIETDKSYYRPVEVESLLGDAKKARKELNWKPSTDITKLVNHMVSEEMKIIKND